MLAELVQEDRMSEDGDEMDRLREVLKKYQLDFDKINIEVPKLHYPNGKTETITKQDLLEYIN